MNQVVAPFGIMIPGQQAQTSFEQVGQYLTCSVSNPAQINQIGFFLMSSLQDGTAACLYFSSPPYQNLTFLGAVANSRPSDLFPTNFALNPVVNTCVEIKLIIQVQPLDENLKNTIEDTQQKQMQYALTIAQNMFNFLQNYNQQHMIVSPQPNLLLT